MVIQVSDPITALRTYLNGLIDEPVYGGELPNAEVPAAGEAGPTAVVLKPAGGPGDRSRLDTQRVRIDIRCYGARPELAMQLYYKVTGVLKYMAAQSVDDVKVLSVVSESGPISTREPETQWPVVISFWVVYARLRAIDLSS